MTAPVSPFEVVAGKWLAALAFYVAAWAPTALMVAYLRAIGGSLDPGPIAAGYLGTLLLGMAALAVGLLASSLTRNQLVAATLSFVLFLAALLAGALESEARAPAVAAALRRYSLFRTMEDFGHGIVDSRPIVLLLSVTVLALAAATARVAALRGPAPLEATAARRAAPRVSAALAVLIAVMVNIIAGRHFARGDWTRAQLYALSDKTIAILRELPRPGGGDDLRVPEARLRTGADDRRVRARAGRALHPRRRAADSRRRSSIPTARPSAPRPRPRSTASTRSTWGRGPSCSRPAAAPRSSPNRIWSSPRSVPTVNLARRCAAGAARRRSSRRS